MKKEGVTVHTTKLCMKEQCEALCFPSPGRFPGIKLRRSSKSESHFVTISFYELPLSLSLKRYVNKGINEVEVKDA